MPTVGRILELAPVACYLAANDTARGPLFGPPVDPKLPILIYGVTKILKRVYDQDPTFEASKQRKVADYLYELIQKYAFKAAAIVDNSLGGQVATPTSVVIRQPYDFYVDDSSLVATGESSVILTEFIGLNVNFSRNEQEQHTTPTTDSTTYFSWNIVTGEFSISQPAQEGERFRIMPDNVGAGGGDTTIIEAADSLFPLTGTGSATGNVTGALDTYTLDVTGGGNTFLHIDPTVGSQQAYLQALDNTGAGNGSILDLNSSATNGTINLGTYFNNTDNSTNINSISDASEAGINIAATNPTGASNTGIINVNATPTSAEASINATFNAVTIAQILLNAQSGLATITLTGVPTYADDAAATGGGLTTGMLYKTTDSGSTYLKIVP